MNTQEFETRKKDHITHAMSHTTQALGLNGLEAVHLFHDALPEIDLKDVSIQSVCLGKKSLTPFYVAGMTAGHQDALAINERLAAACQARGWGFGVGSQRRDLEASQNQSGTGATAVDHSIDRWKHFRARYPKLTVFANLGISQIITAKTKDIERVLDLFQPNALAIHLNALQEAIQPEGTPYFKGALKAISSITRKLKIPVVLKETGCGFSSTTLKKLTQLKIAAVDVSGLGGTHWGRIEGLRAQTDSLQNVASQTFANWGESTASSVLNAHKILKQKTEVWASGGVRSGLDAAKLIALGAHQVGYAQPALKAALEGDRQLERWMEQQEFELKVALFCTGAKQPSALRGNQRLWSIAGT